MNAKALIESKTFWVGLLEIVFAGVGFAFHFIDTTTAISLGGAGLAMIGLRVNTSKPIDSILP